MNAIRPAVNSNAISREDDAVALYVLDRLPDVLANGSRDHHHTTADTLARLDWLISEMEEHGCDSLLDVSIEVLRRARRDALFLMPEHGGVDSTPRKFSGPTVAQMGAAVEGIAKAGADKATA